MGACKSRERQMDIKMEKESIEREIEVTNYIINKIYIYIKN